MGDRMNIHEHYPRTVRREFRPRLRLNRWIVGVCWPISALCALIAALEATTSRTPAPAAAAATTVWAAYAAVWAVLPVVAVWLRLLVDRRVGTGTTIDVTVTERLITRRMGVDVREFGWDMVRRVPETRSFWIFVVNWRTSVTLYKSDLNAEQRAELEAFLARWRSAQSRPLNSFLGL